MDTVYRRYKENPSFSSTLLDEIYRSIDERDHDQLTVPTETKFGGTNGCFEDEHDEGRACFIHKPVVGSKSAAELERDHEQLTVSTETKFGRTNGCFEDDHDQRRACFIQKPVVGRKSAAELEISSILSGRDSLCLNSSSSSSDCSCGGGFSSSENESMYGVLCKPKPIRTSIHRGDEFVTREERSMYDQGYQQPNAKLESKFVKTKSKALKIYRDLKKVKQPISPGGRLATFLNSLFTTGNTKKPKTSSASASGSGGYAEAARSHLDRKSKSANASTCSSASSFSRSCLSNTPSSRGKLSNGLKRSVRFYPVSVIVDEDCQPCGHKSLYEEETGKHSINKEFQVDLSEKKRHIEQVARNMLKNYQKKIEREFNSTRKDEDENESDDAKSDSSSDLFELDNFSTMGMHRYQDELPVYKTTRLDTNRAIANGLLI